MSQNNVLIELKNQLANQLFQQLEKNSCYKSDYDKIVGVVETIEEPDRSEWFEKIAEKAMSEDRNMYLINIVAKAVNFIQEGQSKEALWKNMLEKYFRYPKDTARYIISASKEFSTHRREQWLNSFLRKTIENGLLNDSYLTGNALGRELSDEEKSLISLNRFVITVKRSERELFDNICKVKDEAEKIKNIFEPKRTELAKEFISLYYQGLENFQSHGGAREKHVKSKYFNVIDTILLCTKAEKEKALEDYFKCLLENNCFLKAVEVIECSEESKRSEMARELLGKGQKELLPSFNSVTFLPTEERISWAERVLMDWMDGRVWSEKEVGSTKASSVDSFSSIELDDETEGGLPFVYPESEIQNDDLIFCPAVPQRTGRYPEDCQDYEFHLAAFMASSLLSEPSKTNWLKEIFSKVGLEKLNICFIEEEKSDATIYDGTELLPFLPEKYKIIWAKKVLEVYLRLKNQSKMEVLFNILPDAEKVGYLNKLWEEEYKKKELTKLSWLVKFYPNGLRLEKVMAIAKEETFCLSGRISTSANVFSILDEEDKKITIDYLLSICHDPLKKEIVEYGSIVSAICSMNDFNKGDALISLITVCRNPNLDSWYRRNATFLLAEPQKTNNLLEILKGVDSGSLENYSREIEALSEPQRTIWLEKQLAEQVENGIFRSSALIVKKIGRELSEDELETIFTKLSCHEYDSVIPDFVNSFSESRRVDIAERLVLNFFEYKKQVMEAANFLPYKKEIEELYTGL